MGCGGYRDMKKILENEFVNAANKFSRKKTSGFALDKDEHKNKLVKNLGKNNKISFEEELNMHGDESGVVKPWLENVVCPDYEMNEALDAPKYNIQIDHVFGYTVEDSRQNLYFFGDENIIYISGSLVIIQNINDNSQKIFGGSKRGIETECHDGEIISLTFLKDDISMIASGQRGLRPKIYVWSPHVPSVIYAKFFLPKGTHEVSTLDFDKDGHYLIATGKDDYNTIFVFDMRTKKLAFSKETNKDITGNHKYEYILDTEASEDESECFLVGVNKIFLLTYSNEIHLSSNLTKMIKKIDEDEVCVYTCACHIKDHLWIIANDQGYLYELEHDRQNKYQVKWEVHVSGGSIYNVTCADVGNEKKLFVSDSYCNVYIFSDNLVQLDRYFESFPVKSIDVEKDEEILMGLANGSIVIKYFNDINKKTETIAQSHAKGSIRGVDFISADRIVTVGDDNRIMIWNLKSKKCENDERIHKPEKVRNPKKFKKVKEKVLDTKGKTLIDAQYEDRLSEQPIDSEEIEHNDSDVDNNLPTNKKEEEKKKEKEEKEKEMNEELKNEPDEIEHPKTKSSCVAYNQSLNHIAVGTNDGCITIRDGPKGLSKKVVDDIDIKKSYMQKYEEMHGKKPDEEEDDDSEMFYATTELKYTDDGMFLLATTENGYMVLYDASNFYETKAYFHLNSSYGTILRFDWDSTFQYIQAITSKNKYLFFNLEDYKEIKELTSSEKIKKLEFDKITCKFGFSVQGVYMGSTDPTYISAVCKAHTKSLIVSGDYDNYLNIYNYPCICDNPKVNSFRGHSGKILRIAFSPRDNKIITIAEDDKSIIYWDLVNE